jgi:hypothetical protein
MRDSTEEIYVGVHQPLASLQLSWLFFRSPTCSGCVLLPALIPILLIGGYLLLLFAHYSRSVQQVALADLNGNGHLDAFVVTLRGGHLPGPSLAVYNDGNGRLPAAKK